MKLSHRILLGAFIASAGCATTAPERVDESAAKLLAQYDRTDETMSCLNVTQITSIRPVTEKTFLIRSGANTYYVSDVSGRCNGATYNSTRFEYSTSTGQLCRNEILRVVDNSTNTQLGGCGMGSFVKLKKKPADDTDGETE